MGLFTYVRTGFISPNHCKYVSFIFSKSSMSARKTLTPTIFSRLETADSSTAFRFLMHWFWNRQTWDKFASNTRNLDKGLYRTVLHSPRDNSAGRVLWKLIRAEKKAICNDCLVVKWPRRRGFRCVHCFMAERHVGYFHWYVQVKLGWQLTF